MCSKVGGPIGGKSGVCTKLDGLEMEPFDCLLDLVHKLRVKNFNFEGTVILTGNKDAAPTRIHLGDNSLQLVGEVSGQRFDWGMVFRTDSEKYPLAHLFLLWLFAYFPRIFNERPDSIPTSMGCQISDVKLKRFPTTVPMIRIIGTIL